MGYNQSIQDIQEIRQKQKELGKLEKMEIIKQILYLAEKLKTCEWEVVTCHVARQNEDMLRHLKFESEERVIKNIAREIY